MEKLIKKSLICNISIDSMLRSFFYKNIITYLRQFVKERGCLLVHDSCVIDFSFLDSGKINYVDGFGSSLCTVEIIRVVEYMYMYIKPVSIMN